MIKVSRYGAACFLNTPFINLIYWYRSDILYFLMSLHRANQRDERNRNRKNKI
ncbi:hypothetical protein HMPREF1203_02326 [Bacteroides fragilis HMW 610]|nr:hypothetical protein HMPREF1203_02326 [Bacteroides fragilis HMW 610]